MAALAGLVVLAALQSTTALLASTRVARKGSPHACAALDDTSLMRAALEQAELARRQGEVPVGAVLVSPSGEVIAAARNQVETLSDASAHAEMLCLREAARKTRNWRLHGATMYCTLEPCAMCLAAMQAFRIERLVYGAPDLRLGAVESWVELLEHRHPFHTLDVRGGVLADDAAAMMREFFASRR